MNIEVSILFGAIGALVGIFGVMSTIKNNSKNNISENVHLKGQVDYIARGVDDIRLDIKAQDDKIGKLSERMIRNEEHTKSNSKRIAELEKGL